MPDENLAKLQELTKEINLTVSELKTIKWLSKWEPEVINNIISIVNKLRGKEAASRSGVKTEELLLEKIESAKIMYFDVLQKPERYRKEHELACAETRLITLECLAIEAGLIKSGTI